MTEIKWNPSIDACVYDLKDYEERLSRDESRLFASELEMRIQVHELGSTPVFLDTTAELNDYLQRSNASKGMRIFQIPQQSSVGRLTITANGLRSLISSLGVFPCFLDAIHSFGRKADNDQSSPPACRVRKHGTVEECSFIIKHAEEHGRDDQAFDWSIRQMGVYYQKKADCDQSTVIIVNSAARFRERLKEILLGNEASCGDILALLASTSVRKWPRYLDHLEKRINEANSKATSSSIACLRASAGLDISQSDPQRLHFLRHKLQIVSRALAVNLEAVGAVAAMRGDVRKSTPSGVSSSGNCVQGNLQEDLIWQMERTTWLFGTVDAAAALTPTILSLKAEATMQQLTQKARRDSRTLKTITILTLLYLPASFVSTLLGMGYIHLGGSRPLTLEIKGEFVIFIVLTAFFLIITIGGWIGFERRHKAKMADIQDEKFEV